MPMRNEGTPMPRPEQVTASEILKNSYDYAVLMPYSQNLRDNGNQRLSFYSAFATNATAEAYKAGKINQIILCGETTFGKEMKSTSDLQKEALVRMGIPEQDIIPLKAKNLDNTPFQIEAVARFQKDNDLADKSFLFIEFPFHDNRIKNYINGYSIKNAQTVSAIGIHKHFMPGFNQEIMEEVVPFDEFERREVGIGSLFARQLSTIDKKGRIHKIITRMRGGSVTDNRRVKDETGTHLVLENTTGKKRMAEVAKRKESSKTPQHFDATIIPGENIRKFLGVGYDREYIRGRRDHLSPWSKLQALVPGQLDKKIAGELISTIGKTAGENIPSEAGAMSAYAERQSHPYMEPYLAEKSFDTSSDAEQLATVVKEKGFKNVAVYVPGMHKRRTKKQFGYYFMKLGLADVKLTVLASEDVIRERSPHHRRYINKLRFSPQRLTQDIQEAIAFTILFVDPGGLRLRRRAEKERLKNQS